MSIIYAVLALVSLGLIIGYSVIVGKKEPWLLLLYVCVTIVNIGYFLISVSRSEAFAVLANDIAYLGSAFLSMSMFLTIIRLCGFKISKKLVVSLIAAGGVMFAIIATSGILPWYYKDVSLTFVDGAAKLEKDYGVLHPVYLVYIVGYFSAMVGCIFHSIRKKVIASQKHAVLMAAIVFGNIAVWFVEKFIKGNFEFLSVSYLFSEIILLGVYWMMQDYVLLKSVTQTSEPARPAAIDVAMMSTEEKVLKILSFLPSGVMLTAREREILEFVLRNKKRKEIAEELNLSENTIKTYMRTLYGKLCICSREELNALLLK